jgi:DNA-binding CsgD family transcriptional regulator
VRAVRDRNKNIELALKMNVETSKPIKEISEITGCSIYKIKAERKKLGLTGPYRQIKANELKVLMSDMPVKEIAEKLNMTSEHVSQYRYRHKKKLRVKA